MTPEAAKTFWEDLQRALRQVRYVRQPPVWRRRRTGECRVTITERRAMQAFHLLYGETYSALATRFRRDRHYMPRWIWDDTYRAFFTDYWRMDAGHGRIERRGRQAARADDARSAA